jgi:DNA adenine methylase
LDPPYYPLSPTSSFTDYTSPGFGEKEQIRLKELCDKLTQKGVLFLQSNSDCEYIRNLYNGYSIREVEVRRSISSKKDKRDNITEV